MVVGHYGDGGSGGPAIRRAGGTGVGAAPDRFAAAGRTEFVLPLDEEMLAYFREMADVLVERIGISREDSPFWTLEE